MEAIKATQFKRLPRKKPTGALRYDARTITLRGRDLTLSCIGKRVKVKLHIPEYFREVYETWEFSGATVTYSKHSKQFWVRLVFEKDDPPREEKGERRNKKMNKWMGSWPFYQLEQFLAYKSEAKGKIVGYVDARYTSKRCNRCGHQTSANRSKSRFKCGSFNYHEHADLNAAYNIRDRYILSSIQTGTEELSFSQ